MHLAQIDKPFIIRAELDKTAVSDVRGSFQKVRCATSKGLVFETPPIGIIPEASLFWRARVTDAKNSDYSFIVTMDGKAGSVEKKVLSTMTEEGISPEKTKWYLENLLFSLDCHFWSRL